MLAEIFKAVLIMSAVGGVLIAVLLALKPLTKRIFGDKWQFYIWLSVLVVLILPVKFKGVEFLPAGKFSENQIVSAIPEQTVQLIETFDGVYLLREEGQGSHTLIIKWFYVLALLWAAVAAVLLVRTVICGVSLKNRLYRNSVFVQSLARAEIRQCSLVGSPILFGGLKPVLYIPEGLQGSRKLQYITAHEGVHLRRNDIGIKWFVALVKCVHWFNPLVYAAARQIDEACEISCDVEATREMAMAEKTEYMQTVLEISQNEIEFRSALSAGLTVDGRILKKRFIAVCKPVKNSRVVFALGIAAAFAITFCTVCLCGIIRGSAEPSSEPARLVLVAEKNTQETTDESKTPEIEEQLVQTEGELAAEESKIEGAIEKESEIEATQRRVIRGEFNSQGGDTRFVYGISPDENGCISVEIYSNAQETIDIYISDAETGRDVYSFVMPVPYEASYSMDGLDSQKTYNVVLKGAMRNDWNIESEYIIY